MAFEDIRDEVRVSAGWPIIMAYGLERIRQDMIDAQRYRALREHGVPVVLRGERMDIYADLLVKDALEQQKNG